MKTMRHLFALGAAMSAIAGTVAAGSTASAAPAAKATPAKDIPTLESQVTEEGQRVIYDLYTWQRRELAKRLPLEEAWPSDKDIGAQFERFNLTKPPFATPFPLPSRIMEDVYLVNSEPNLAYLIDGGADGLILVDPGMPSSVDSIRNNVEKLGFDPKQIKWVVNTHAHFDHSMADAAFQKLGAKILIGRGDVPAVEKGTNITARWALPYLAPQFAAAPYPTLKVDWPVDDGEQIQLGNKLFTAIHTPGHTPGSTCYLLTIGGKNILFGGDTLLFDYRLAAQPEPYSDNAAYLASLKKLTVHGGPVPLRTRWDVLLPGHGTMVLDRAYADVIKGYRQVQIDAAEGKTNEALPFANDAYRKIMFGRP